ncbi:hypothetical protein MJG53_012191 [Ovis ammon polii x Ovis aries]|uniref:Uncharacterized protein n=1 Tax=Ovis ammon polii x Ovis aries TaxID=2918886 RepID=A0ACB9UMF9_9CETA|nr:hypothetical protein MJG53_012191 [Ovis ammon polii x Ovis aries]
MRDTAATALEESASACPHSRRGLTPLGRLQKYPKIHVSTGEESSGSGPEFTQGLRPRHQRERNSERPPRNSHGDWPFLRPPERVPEGPVPRIDSHHVCTWDSPVGKPRGKDTRENHRCFDPRGGLRDTAATTLEESASACPHSRRGLTPLGRLQKYPKIHVSTGEESSGSGPEFTQGLRPRHQRERNSERPPRNSHGDWPFLRPPERVPEGPVPRIDSHHVCTWDSPVGKPRGKDTRENHRCFDPRGGLRDTAATALEESASACPHSRRGLTPLGRLQKYPKIHVSTGEESSGSGPEFTQGLRPRHQRERNSERPPRNSHGDWPFLRPPERVPEGPVPRIDSHHVCTWDSPVGKPRGKDTRENHRCFDPRGGLRDTAATALEESASACPHSRRGLTPLGRLQKYPKIHVSTGEESSGSGPEFTQGLRPRHQRERNSERPPRNSHGDWPFLRPPERVPEGPVPRIDSHHVCTWDSPVGKPRGKDTRENHRCFDPRGGLRDTAATALEESASACPHSRRGLTPLGRLQKYPKIHVSTGEESSGSGPEFTQGLRPRHQRERNSERPPRNSHGDWPFLRPPERVPEGPVPRIDSHHVCTWDSPVGKPRGKDTRENHRCFDPRGGLRDTAATALEESASACPHSRRGLTPLGRLQKYPKIHVSTGEESSGSGPEFTQGLRPRHQRERNSERPPRNSHGDWPFLRPPERVPEGPVPRIDSHHVCTWDSPVGKPRGKDTRENHRCFDPRGGLRDTAATALEESASACPHSRRGLTPLGRLQKYPKIHVSTGEESSGSGPEFTQGLRPRHQRERNSERPPRNSHGDWPFLRPPERVPEGPVPRIDSHHVCTWDSPVGKPRGKDTRENHRCFDPRGGLCDTAATALEESASACPHSRRGLTPLGRLQKYPKIHVSTGEESSGSGPEFIQGLRPRHQRERNSERPPRNSHGDWPFLRPPERVPEGPVGKNSRRSRRISRGGALHRKGERNSRVVPPFQESPRCVSPFQRNRFSLHCLDVQAEDRLPPRVHVGQPCGKASWESLVGKPRGKDTRENHRCFDPRGGLRDTAATALEESASACPHSRRGLTPLGKLQKYPKIHVSTGEESSGSGPEFTQGLRPRHQRERNSERPPRNSHGDWPFLRPPERVPEGPVGKNSRRSRRISRGGALHRKGERNSRVVPPFQESPRCVSPFQRNRFSLHCLDVQAEDRLPPRVHVGQPCGKASWESLVGKPRGKDTRENHRCFDPRGGLRDTAATALEESASACPHSRRGLTPLGKLQKYPKIHVSTGEESSGSGPEFTQGLRPRHQRERNSERPPRNSHGDWPFLRPPERVPEGPVKYPKIHVSTGEESSGSGPEFTQGLRPRHQRERNSERPPRNSHGDWPFLRPPERVPEGPVKYPKIHVSTGEESSGSGPEFTQGLRPRHQRERNSERPPRNSHGDWPFLRPPERVPEGPVKYPKIHVSTGEESSGSGPEFTQGLRPRHQRERNSERPPRNSHGDWPFLRPPERVPEGPVGKNSRRSRRISRGGALHRKGERNSRVVPPFQESPRCVSPFQRNRFSLHCLDVQAEDRLPPRVHVGQRCGKASWESLVGKTGGNTIDALIHGADCVTLLLPLWRKAQVHARIRDED